jgi:ABC-type bacteriocin/lantibiotic exporter with double-glycine peptidase domain
LEETTIKSQSLETANNTMAEPGQILLDNVTATWPGSPDDNSSPTLKKLSCKLEGDKVVVIIGSVGAGKVCK